MPSEETTETIKAVEIITSYYMPWFIIVKLTSNMTVSGDAIIFMRGRFKHINPSKTMASAQTFVFKFQPQHIA